MRNIVDALICYKQNVGSLCVSITMSTIPCLLPADLVGMLKTDN